MLNIGTCLMQEVLMLMSRGRRGPAQLPLFVSRQSNPEKSPPWATLSTDAQQKIVRLLAQLLQHHRTSLCATAAAEEVGDE